ncbi:MAG: GNAT family N-acetyltransferase [Actinomycetota bacterium]|jgi:GNAT superfamily N-acetyltransferase|nr:GNAT family N-acetyltransferase [Actinomycetota bacterium]
MEGVRAAEPGDAVRFAELVWALRSAVVSQRGGEQLVARSVPATPGVFDVERFEAILRDETRVVLVGTIDGTVVGVAVGRADPIAGGSQVGHLEACYVEPGARGVGVGRLLLDSVVAWCDERGCRGIDGVALPGDRSAKQFFESAGFKARLLVMHRPAPGPEG